MQELSEIQARVLGCLMEKKETTPEQYPLTTNSLRLACNQKTARHPISNYSEGEAGRAVRELIAMGLVREAWGARVAKYEHDAGKALGLQGKALAVLCPLILRGPQTLGEIRTNAQRLHAFEDLDDVQHMLRRLAEHEPPLVLCLPRQSGQKEERYVHLLCGQPRLDTFASDVRPAPARQALEQRIEALESALEAFDARLSQLESAAPIL
ncbi:MAG TPA: YceH family protein [Xanthomonadales bacterium]|nr:YceH family protein [Xanthomonadales bacterium]